MIKQKGIAKTPREHFMRTAEDEFEKFEGKERAFQGADRDERAAQLRFPLARENLPSIENDKPK